MFFRIKQNNSYIFPGLFNESSLSVGQLWDDNCIDIFTKNNVFILKQNKVIIQCSRHFSDGLWDVRLPSSTPVPTNNVMNINFIIIKDKS